MRIENDVISFALNKIRVIEAESLSTNFFPEADFGDLFRINFEKGTILGECEIWSKGLEGEGMLGFSLFDPTKSGPDAILEMSWKNCNKHTFENIFEQEMWRVIQFIEKSPIT